MNQERLYAVFRRLWPELRAAFASGWVHGAANAIDGQLLNPVYLAGTDAYALGYRQGYADLTTDSDGQPFAAGTFDYALLMESVDGVDPATVEPNPRLRNILAECLEDLAGIARETPGGAALVGSLPAPGRVGTCYAARLDPAPITGECTTEMVVGPSGHVYASRKTPVATGRARAPLRTGRSSGAAGPETGAGE